MVPPYVIAGPTGSGKSDFALDLAQKIGGEIICADSRQVYMGMEVGTASPTAHEKGMVAHHNYNVVDPHKNYDAGRFIEDADRIMSELCARGKVPILVGGTGLYLRCWRFGLSDVPEKDSHLREQLHEEAKQRGILSLYEELVRIDQSSSEKISPRDEFRIIRALEIFKLTGKKPSELRRSHFSKPKREAEYILLNADREWLNARLHRRTKEMFANGLVEEAVALRAQLPEGNALLQTIGYKESLEYADGALDLPSAIESTFIRTRQYAKRQVAWFSKENWWLAVEPLRMDSLT